MAKPDLLEMTDHAHNKRHEIEAKEDAQSHKDDCIQLHICEEKQNT